MNKLAFEVGLGHRRLSIIDLSEAAHQPMCNEDGRIWIVFNGEIYNFQEIREGLEKKGHSFKSKSDTEVILHAYEEWGVECLNHFRGMFAFAIWDSKLQRLFMARDRLGKKPLVYFQPKRSFCLCFGDQGPSSSSRGRKEGKWKCYPSLFNLSICSVSGYHLRRYQETSSCPLPPL